MTIIFQCSPAGFPARASALATPVPISAVNSSQRGHSQIYVRWFHSSDQIPLSLLHTSLSAKDSPYRPLRSVSSLFRLCAFWTHWPRCCSWNLLAHFCLKVFVPLSAWDGPPKIVPWFSSLVSFRSFLKCPFLYQSMLIPLLYFSFSFHSSLSNFST